MSERTVRGYILQSCIDYVETKLPLEARAKVYASLPPEVSRDREKYDQVAWYPMIYAASFYRGIALATGGSDQAVYDALLECGCFMAGNATNTFMKLLMKIMTPAVFAKKAPDFWSRDSRCGFMESDTSQLAERKLVVHLRDIEDFTHTAPVAGGFATFAMQAIGVKNLEVKQTGWSLATPAPKEVRFDISWS